MWRQSLLRIAVVYNVRLPSIVRTADFLLSSRSCLSYERRLMNIPLIAAVSSRVKLDRRGDPGETARSSRSPLAEPQRTLMSTAAGLRRWCQNAASTNSGRTTVAYRWYSGCPARIFGSGSIIDDTATPARHFNALTPWAHCCDPFVRAVSIAMYTARTSPQACAVLSALTTAR